MEENICKLQRRATEFLSFIQISTRIFLAEIVISNHTYLRFFQTSTSKMTLQKKGVYGALLVGLIAAFLTADVFQEARGSAKTILVSILGVISKLTGQKDPFDTSDSLSAVYNVVSGKDDHLYTKEELSKYDGSEGSPGLYLGILGRVYDVSAGERHYGEKGGYGFFRARDGTRAFMTGVFNETGLIDDVEGLSYREFLELEDWIKFYDTTYIYKGKLVGNFYDSEGNPTAAMLKAEEDIKDSHVKKREEEAERRKMPPCNSHAKEGVRRVWCTNRSGGIIRDWVGVPRALYRSGATVPSCVCVRPEDLNNPQLKVYDNCKPTSESCNLPPIKK